MEIAFNVDAVYAAAQQERQAHQRDAKPVFENGWYLGVIEQYEKVPTADRTKLYKVVVELRVFEHKDRSGRSRLINGHLCFGHQDHIPRKLAYEGLADIGYATGAVVRRPDGSQAVSFDDARGIAMGVRLVKKPHKFTPSDGPNAGKTIDMFINRVNGYGPLDRVPEPTVEPQAPTEPQPPVQAMPGNPMGGGDDGFEDVPF